MKLRLFAVAYCLLSLGAVIPVLAAAPESPWESLRHLPKHHLYTVLNRDGSCITGTFVSVSEDTFVIDQGGEKPLPKSGILRISTGETADVHTTVFSARSSWADVQALQSPPYYSNILLIASDGRQFSGPLIGVWSDQISLMVNGNEMRFAKEFLNRVFLTGKKPAFEPSGTHWNPIALSRKVISPTQPIPLYEVTAQQDNTAVACSTTPRTPASVK